MVVVGWTDRAKSPDAVLSVVECREVEDEAEGSDRQHQSLI